jgi:hypothetical protein
MLYNYTFGDDVQNGTWDGKEESWTLTVGEVGLLGCGSSRRCWTVDGEVAYKVGLHDDHDNIAEYDRYVSYSHKMPEGTRLPEMSRYYVGTRMVIAVEIIRFPRQWNRYVSIPALPFAFLDNGDYNYRVAPDGTFIPIDFAF